MYKSSPLAVIIFIIALFAIPLFPGPVSYTPTERVEAGFWEDAWDWITGAEEDKESSIATLQSSEVISSRQENSKTFYRGGSKYSILAGLGAIHYKENYSDFTEQWKEIDTTIVNGRVDKAPYILDIDYDTYTITITSRKYGSVTTVQLDSLGLDTAPKKVSPTINSNKAVFKDVALDTDIEIVAGNSHVQFKRILKSNQASSVAKFKVNKIGSGIDITCQARDSETGLEVEVLSSEKDGILTEWIDSKELKDLKYPHEIDPSITVSVAASTDDARKYWTGAAWNWSTTSVANGAGYFAAATQMYGCGLRFLNITIPNASTIDTANITFKAYISRAGNNANSILSCEDTDDAATFSTIGDFDTRYAARTTARVNWNAIAAWTVHNFYVTPEIKTIIQEVIDRGGWSSGNDLVVFWEDFDDNSTHAADAGRQADSWNDADVPPKLYIEYTVPVPTIPTLDSLGETNIEETTATITGNVTAVGDTNITQRGFVWGTTCNATMPSSNEVPPASYDDFWIESGTWGTGSFSHGLTGLLPGRCYCWRTTANNTQGEWGYSAEDVFQTKPLPPTNFTATTGVGNSIDLAWTVGTGADNTYIRGKLGSAPTTRVDGAYSATVAAPGNSVNHAVGVADQHWYYIAWSGATDCGEPEQLSDAPDDSDDAWSSPQLDVVTLSCSGVGQDWAVINGRVDDVGPGATTIDQRGFNYGLTDAYGDTILETGTWGNDPFTASLTTLSPATVYHYRATAINDLATQGYGLDRLFATKGSPVPYENWNTSCNGTGEDIYGANWSFQTFTTESATLSPPHSVSSVKLDLRRILTPGSLTVSIRHTAGGVPTGEDLAVGIIDADTFELTPTWFEVEMTPETCLTENTTYAIVLNALSGTVTDYVDWEEDPDAGYADGDAGYSDDSGVTWVTDNTSDYCFEIWGNPCLEVGEAKAFSDYIEVGDWLITCLYTNIAEPYYDDNNVEDFFYLQLVDPDDDSVKAQTKCAQWGYRPGSIYLSPAMVASLEWGKDYRVRLFGDYGENPFADYALLDEDWMGVDLKRLDSWVRTVIVQIEAYYGTSISNYVSERGLVLNDDGNVIFSTGIPTLSQIRPGLFQTVGDVLEYTEPDYDQSLQPTLVWQTMLGAYFTDVFTSFGTIFGGVSGSTVGAILGFMLYVLVAIYAFPAGHAIAAAVIPFPILIAVWGTGLAELVVMGVLLGVAILLLIWSFIFRGA